MLNTKWDYVEVGLAKVYCTISQWTLVLTAGNDILLEEIPQITDDLVRSSVRRKGSLACAAPFKTCCHGTDQHKAASANTRSFDCHSTHQSLQLTLCLYVRIDIVERL